MHNLPEQLVVGMAATLVADLVADRLGNLAQSAHQVLDR